MQALADRLAGGKHVVERDRHPGDCKRRFGLYVTVYSGPEPPSGGVRRPPLAVIAPHWTQFEGVTSTRTVPSAWLSPTS